MKSRLKLVLAAMFALVLANISGCSAFAKLGDYVADNPLIAQVATRQAVAQYISGGETLEEEIERAEQIKKRVKKVLLFVDENEAATVSDLMAVIDSSIEWDQLTYADRLLVQDIVSLVEIELNKATVPRLSEDARIVISTLFKTALSAAELYLVR